MNATAVKDWELFRDWCASVDADATPAGRDLVEAFLTDLPAAPSTQLRRVRAIRAGLHTAGYTLDIPRTPASSTVRHGDGWAGVRRALAQLPTLRHPAGLRGRRDGWLLVLIAELGFTRREATLIAADDVILHPQISVAGRPVPRTAVAVECPACAVTRWLRALGPAANGYRSEVRALLDPRGADTDTHDCAVGLDGQWRAVTVLTPAIDKHGWVNTSAPISLVTASTIMVERQRLAGMPDRATALFNYEGRLKNATSAEIIHEQDEVDKRVSELLARTAQILNDSETWLPDSVSVGS